MRTIKFLTAFAVLFISFNASAQFKTAKLQASGLTCSMCSKAVYTALSKVASVETITSDIKTSTYSLTFKKGVKVDFDALQKAVKGAGFNVAALTVTANFSSTAIKNDAHTSLSGNNLHFINVTPQTISGDVSFKVVDKNFVTSKEFKKYNTYTKMKCYETGVMQSCCSKDGAKQRIYHITLI